MALLRAAATNGAMTLLSRIVGFLRDIVIARLVGASAEADAFFVAFRIPNLFRRLFAEGSFSQAFVPILAEAKTQREHAQVKQLCDRVAGTLAGVLLLFTVIGAIAAPLLVMIFAPGFIADADKFAVTSEMLRITFPYLLLVSLAAFAGSILNTYGRFGVPAFTPVLLNASIIAAAVWLAPRCERPVVALAWGVLAGGVLQLLWQLPYLHRLGLLPRPRWSWHDSDVRRVLALMLPALFGASVAQINLLINTQIASFLPTGSVSWLYYTDRLLEFPLGVFGVALATVVLPSLSKQHTSGARADFSATLDWALRWVFIITLPATVGLVMLAAPMLGALFQYGKMSVHDVNMSAYSLMAYASGLVSFTLVKVLVPGFFARQDSKTPVRIGMIAVAANIVLNLALTPLWAQYGLGHVGLALATVLASVINALLLYRVLRREAIYTPASGWWHLLRQVLVAMAVMAAVLLAAQRDLAAWADWGALARATHLAAWISAAGGAYFAALWLQGLRVAHVRAPRAAKPISQ